MLTSCDFNASREDGDLAAHINSIALLSGVIGTKVEALEAFLIPYFASALVVAADRANTPRPGMTKETSII